MDHSKYYAEKQQKTLGATKMWKFLVPEPLGDFSLRQLLYSISIQAMESPGLLCL
ncbi:hypothetical protein J6590_078725 [Homalodisca vitripennis]|nr:hypothetical protein J6590_078725 [Homalodisca vitripennis]